MLKKFLLGTAGVLVAASMASTAANALVIDSFTTELSVGFMGITIVDNGAVGNLSQFDRSVSGGGDILGGDRELLVTNTGTRGQIINANVAGGNFSHNNGNGTGRSLLRWDGTAGDTDGLNFNLGGANTGVDLTGGGTIHISVLQADLTGSSVTLTLYTNAGNYSTALVALPTGPSEHFLSLAAIASIDTAGTGVTLADVRAIELLAIGSASFDVAIDIIDVVPEPASLSLLGAGIMGLGAVKRRRRA